MCTKKNEQRAHFLFPVSNFLDTISTASHITQPLDFEVW